MRIYNNVMVNFQRRMGGLQMDTIKKEQPGKTQDNMLNAQYGKTDNNLKSPTERLLSTYFDIEV